MTKSLLDYLIETNYEAFIVFVRENRDLLKYIRDSDITSKYKLKKSVLSSNVTRYNFVLYHSFEFFKKYLGDQNIYKDYKLLWHLFSIKTPFDYDIKTNIVKYVYGNNILILEYSTIKKLEMKWLSCLHQFMKTL